MSAAPKLSPEEETIATLEKVVAGEWVHCLPGNPFYDLDLSLLVELDQVKNYAEEDPTVILGQREKKFRFEIWSAGQKQEILSQLKARFEGLGMNRALVEDILSCSDELITNAVFNAPFAQKIDRKTSDLEIPGGKPVIVELSVGETDVMVTCADPYGSLNIEAFFKKMLACYRQGLGASINYGEGGAGIGSFMIFDPCLSLIVGMSPGKRTTFHCRFPIKMSSKTRRSLPKNLIIFKRED
jgi:hypothetical protein